MLFQAVNRGVQRAAITESSELYRALIGQSSSNAGVAVNVNTALQVTTVMACVRAISETVGQLPFILYERDGDFKHRATSNRLYSLLHNAPNDFQTSAEWRETKTVHCLLQGNGYSFLNRSKSGEVVEILPLLPDRMTVTQDKQWRIKYVYTDLDGNQIAMRADQVWRLTGLSRDGIHGMSPIQYNRNAIGIALAADKHSALAFKNGAKPTGILSHPSTFKDSEVQKRVRETWDAAMSGDNAYTTAVLEDGMTWKGVSMSPSDLQHLETKNFNVEEIARLFRTQPHKIGHMAGATFSNIEHQNTEFVVDTMMPWFVRWSQTCYRDVLTKKEKEKLFAEILVLGLLRGDSQARSDYYDAGTQWGRLSPNECRAMENQNPRADGGGDDYLVPMNMETSERRNRSGEDGENDK